jgi:hypothetical protein
MAARREPDGSPKEFLVAVEQLRSARVRPEVAIEEMPAPQRIAPFAQAVTADVVVNGEELGTGRLVLLHDPAGNDTWQGTFRCVAFARAEIEPEMITDPLLPAVGWSWLSEALLAHGAVFGAASGTVTTVMSEGFGGMAEDGSKAEIEIRASWTPAGDLAPHAEAWAELLCTAAGLPPLPPGVVPMPGRRARRS